jgi:excisionase family DNA binding protein
MKSPENSKQSNDQKFLTPTEVGEILKVDAQTVKRYCKHEDLTYHRFGKHYRIEQKDLEAFISARKISA